MPGEGLRGDGLYRPPKYESEVTPPGYSGDQHKEATEWPDGVPPPRDLESPHVLTGDKPGRVPDARRPLSGE